MTHPLPISCTALDAAAVRAFPGRIALVLPPGAAQGLPRGIARTLDRAMRGALSRFAASDAFGSLKDGEAADLAFPAGLAAEAVQVVRLPPGADALAARRAGGAVGARLGKAGVLVLPGATRAAAELALGLMLRAYDFRAHKGAAEADKAARGPVTLMVRDPAALAPAMERARALAEGVVFTRDLVNEPANVLTTAEFADRLVALREHGVEVEVLEEDELARLGMRALLGVGQGSESPSKVVVMQWKGAGGSTPPFALVGKGVVFDTGGISIKPAAGMEEMTMDMGGAGVVAGVMKALALAKVPANVVGLVGLVENMPDGRAQRPGDIVRSMKGDTIEINNTDAEGRLVLADVLWYAQERFRPAGIVDLATLTGAIVVALGAENAGLFANDDALADAVLAAAKAEGEGAWRMPMGKGYDRKLKSRLADMLNSAGREAGAVTAAQFLARFVKEGMPWVHLDIAGVTLAKADGDLAPKGATGWGVLTLARMLADRAARG